MGHPEHPILHTQRLLLREITIRDADAIQGFLDDADVSRSLLSISHPFSRESAVRWIVNLHASYEAGGIIGWGVFRRQSHAFMGAITLHPNERDNIAEIGYWLGKPYWGCGYATEAVKEVLRYAFEERLLDKVHALHFGSNPASGRVLEKAGMTYEGTRREHFLKWRRREDAVLYGVLARDWKRPRI